jgi:prophage regulatory protein
MERLLSLKEVRAACGGLGTSTLYRLISSGQFPRPVPLHGSRVAWRETEIEAWIGARIAAAQGMQAVSQTASGPGRPRKNPSPETVDA